MSILTPSEAELVFELRKLKNEVDALQIRVMRDHKPWYHDVSTIVAALAFIFTLTTTAVGLVEAHQQKVEANRAALRDFVQQLLAIPEELAKVEREYANDPSRVLYFSGLVKQKNTAVARQAAEVLERIPNHVSTVECIAVVNALMLTTDDPAIARLLDIAEKRSTDFYDRLHVIKNRAAHLMPRDPAAARREFARGLTITAEADLPPREKQTHDMQTETYWAEIDTPCREAKLHLSKALNLAADVPRNDPHSPSARHGSGKITTMYGWLLTVRTKN